MSMCQTKALQSNLLNVIILLVRLHVRNVTKIKGSQSKLNCYCADHVGALGLVSDAQCMDSCGKVKVGVLLCGMILIMNRHNVYSIFKFVL